MTPPCLSAEDYTVGWVCALPVEHAAAALMLDERHQTPPKHATDSNTYLLGQIGVHNVVIVCLPSGRVGTNSAAAVASQMRSTFVSIEFVLIVGIGGGVPGAQADIRLGDVVISQPNSQYHGVVQYDFGKIGLGGRLTRTGSLNAPPTVLLSALATFQSSCLTYESGLSIHLAQLISHQKDFSPEKAGPDILFEPDYDHIEGQACDLCNKDRIVERPPRGRQEPVVHYGTIASGNVVMKDGVTRNLWSKDLGGVLCFEMEAAGLMNSFPCLVIRGICDYADSHKNKGWQPYAAATAAACTKDLLSVMSPGEAAKIHMQRKHDLALDESQDTHCLRDLRLTDPRDDKKRIEATKDILLEDCCAWIFRDPDFLDWNDNRDARLLWIKGDPGKGKTMMMITLVNKLSKDLERGSCVLSYFFCQSFDSRLNNAAAVLRGLIYLLAVKQKSLIRHLRKRYDTAGSQLFEGPNTVYALSTILSDMLNDSSLERVYFMVDALDECDSGLSQLLDVMAPRKPELSSKVKWLVASRNRPDIEERLRPDCFLLKISLELNPSHISRAVKVFIDIKVSELAEQKRYDNELGEEVRSYLLKNAEDTFLWVALVCKELGDVPSWEAQSVLEEFPPGLEPLYDRMIDQIQQGKSKRRVQLYKRILTTVALAFRPMHLKELRAAADLPKTFSGDLRSVSELVELCGSFLTVRGDMVYFVHQSAKDYFSTTKGSSRIFSSSRTVEHLKIACRSLKLMSGALKRNIYDLQMPGALPSEARSISEDPLAHIRYACCYWVGHLYVSGLQQDQAILCDQVHEFLSEHFLHWLEALSLMGKMSEGVLMITALQSMLTPKTHTKLRALVHDARRFILSHRYAIEIAPLQVYNSALVFSPAKSIIRDMFSDQLPTWIRSLPVVEEIWSPSLQTLEGYSGEVHAVAFSPDGQLLASGSWDTVRLWDPVTGAMVQTLTGHSSLVSAVAFSPDSQILASGSSDKTVRLWDPATGVMLQTLMGHSSPVSLVIFSPDSRLLASRSWDKMVRLWDPSTGAMVQALMGDSSRADAVTFSPDSRLLASGPWDNTVQLWDPATGVMFQTLVGHSKQASAAVFSPDSRLLASGSYDNTIRLWNPATGAIVQTLTGHSEGVAAVTFSPDSQLLASGSYDSTVRLWDPTTGATVLTLAGHSSRVSAVTFSPDSLLLASGSYDNTVRLWDPATGAMVQTLTGHSSPVSAVIFSLDSRLLASGSWDRTVRLWDLTTGTMVQALTGHSGGVSAVTLSPDSWLLASGSWDNTVRLWDSATGTMVRILTGHSDRVSTVTFSPDGRLLASGSHDDTVRLWNPTTGVMVRTLADHSSRITTVNFSPDNRLLASGSWDKTVRLWDLATGAMLQTLTGHSHGVTAVTFSPDNRLLASGSYDAVRLWDPATGVMVQALRGHSSWVSAVAFSPDSRLLASGSWDKTVRLWDVNTGESVQVFPTKYHSRKLSFNMDESRLETDREKIQLNLPPMHYIQPISSPRSPYGLDKTHHWVTWNSHNILFLPTDRRPIDFVVKGNLLAIGHHSGQISFFEFQPDTSPLGNAIPKRRQ